MTTPNAPRSHRSIFQIGAAGGVGRRLTALLTHQGHRVTGMYRAGGQDLVIREAGGTPVAGDLIDDSVPMLAERLAGHDAVVFSAGAHGTGPEMTTAIDGHGLEKAAAAAITSGVRRFVLVSVFMDALRDQPRSEGFEHYMRVKRAADVYLASTDSRLPHLATRRSPRQPRNRPRQRRYLDPLRRRAAGRRSRLHRRQPVPSRPQPHRRRAHLRRQAHR